MDPLEKVRRWKRSLDGYVSFRKAVLITLCCLAFILYVGPSIFSWLFLSNRQKAQFYQEPPPSCISDKLGQLYHEDLNHFNAHIRHSPKLSHEEGPHYLEYVGNGHFGVAPPYAAGISDGDPDDVASNSGDALHDASFFIRGGNQRVLRTRVNYKPVLKLSVDRDFVPIRSQHTASVVSYLKGLIHTVECYRVGREPDFSVDHQVYAHRTIPHVLVQEIKISNPTSSDKLFNIERIGISKWDGAESNIKRIEAGDGGKRYYILSGVVKLDDPFSGFANSPFARNGGGGGGGQKQFLWQQKKARDGPMYSRVVIAAPVLDNNVVVAGLKTHPMTVITGIVHSEPLKLSETKDAKVEKDLEARAVEAVKQALGLTSEELRQKHRQVWKSLWTTGFGISHSMADESVNGHQINATMYYVLSQAPTPLHSMATSKEVRTELMESLSYPEGCYGSLPTLHETKNLWRIPDSLYSVNNVVQYWFLNLEVNGCHKLLSAGADGVVQAMVLSFAGLKFRQHHLELDANPKDLHRDYQIRRVSYGNSTHLNISVVINADNKAEIEVTLDRKNRDYFACDAGCLDSPVKLSASEVKRFPVKLTDPVTAVLYITSDYEHMRELKHTIHVKEVNDAPAHEHHVIELHKHGNKLGGLPMIFWVSIGSLIVVFHVFLFKLIWQEYCASGGPEKYRTRKYSDFK